jgi:hypothetical protein
VNYLQGEVINEMASFVKVELVAFGFGGRFGGLD